MILFSWKKLYTHSKGRAAKIIEIVEYLTYNPIPKNIQDPAYTFREINWLGHSFLLNPEKLLEARKEYTLKEMAEYVGVASFRNYATYKATGKLTLDLICCPINQDTINKNRLLTIENDQIHFRWEAKEK